MKETGDRHDTMSIVPSFVVGTYIRRIVMSEEEEEEEELEERRLAELEVVQAAYPEPNEVSYKSVLSSSPNNNNSILLQRILHNVFVIHCQLRRTYPETPLIIDTVQVLVNTTNPNHGGSAVPKARHHHKTATLKQACVAAAERYAGHESILCVFQAAEDWYVETFGGGGGDNCRDVASTNPGTVTTATTATTTMTVYFIFSHHIIGKQKRSDMKALFEQLHLTGFIKIGWPGLVVVEGERNCVRDCYATIRRWNWQHLTLREEEEYSTTTSTTTTSTAATPRRLGAFCEVETLPEAARLCRNAGLEAPFRRSLKLPPSTTADE